MNEPASSLSTEPIVYCKGHKQPSKRTLIYLKVLRPLKVTQKGKVCAFLQKMKEWSDVANQLKMLIKSEDKGKKGVVINFNKVSEIFLKHIFLTVDYCFLRLRRFKKKINVFFT